MAFAEDLLVSYNPLIPITPPLLSVPAETYVTQGQNASLSVQASKYITWKAVGTPTFTTQNVLSGTGSRSFAFQVNSNVPVGTSSAFSFNTSPPSATAQVPANPLEATVYVTSTLPKSGVLIAGGMDWNGNAIGTAQVWDPSTGSLDRTNYPMMQARYGHAGTLILSGAGNTQNGKVLIAGGFAANGTALTSTELFDPTTGIFTAGPSMTHAHANQATVRMNSGNILIIGGVDETNNATNIVDVYNPYTNTFGAPLQLTSTSELYGDFAAGWWRSRRQGLRRSRRRQQLWRCRSL
jgi:hypothetical protein